MPANETSIETNGNEHVKKTLAAKNANEVLKASAANRMKSVVNRFCVRRGNVTRKAALFNEIASVPFVSPATWVIAIQMLWCRTNVTAQRNNMARMARRVVNTIKNLSQQMSIFEVIILTLVDSIYFNSIYFLCSMRCWRCHYRYGKRIKPLKDQSQ